MSNELDACLENAAQKQVYATSFGTVKVGDTKEKIKKIFGNPHYTTIAERTEMWYYYFPSERTRFFVFFGEDKVIDVKTRTNEQDIIAPKLEGQQG